MDAKSMMWPEQWARWLTKIASSIGSGKSRLEETWAKEELEEAKKAAAPPAPPEQPQEGAVSLSSIRSERETPGVDKPPPREHRVRRERRARPRRTNSVPEGPRIKKNRSRSLLQQKLRDRVWIIFWARSVLQNQAHFFRSRPEISSAAQSGIVMLTARFTTTQFFRICHLSCLGGDLCSQATSLHVNFILRRIQPLCFALYPSLIRHVSVSRLSSHVIFQFSWVSLGQCGPHYFFGQAGEVFAMDVCVCVVCVCLVCVCVLCVCLVCVSCVWVCGWVLWCVWVCGSVHCVCRGLCVCVSACVPVCLYIFWDVCLCVYKCVIEFMCLYVCLCVCVCVCSLSVLVCFASVWLCVCVFTVCACVCVSVCLSVSVSVSGCVLVLDVCMWVCPLCLCRWVCVNVCACVCVMWGMRDRFVSLCVCQWVLSSCVCGCIWV